VKAKGEYAANLGLGGVFTWTVDQDNGVLVNAAREGLGYEISKEVIDMEPFYFEGINVEEQEDEKEDEGKDEDQTDDQPEDDTVPTVNHAPKAAIELLVVGGSRVRLSGAKSSDEDNDVLRYSWGVPADITVEDKTAEVIEFIVPKVSVDTDFIFTLFVRDSNGEPSTQQRFVLSVVPASSAVNPDEDDDYDDGEEDEEHDDMEDDDVAPQPEDDAVQPDENAPHPWWNATTIYGANWGSFEIVSWKGHNYQVKWWSCGDQPDENCSQGSVWTDLGAY